MATSVGQAVSMTPGGGFGLQTPRVVVSPLHRKRGFVMSKDGGSYSPLPVSVATSSVMLEINDDEAEKRNRRQSRVLEMQHRNLVSPATPSDRRQSLPLSGLTNAQLAEHYADCIKLSTENKISAKNAFGLHLIDYMSELFKKKEVTDFQLASSTLDASAKIYAGRVDAIHSDAYKVLTGLGRSNVAMPKDSEDQENAEDERREDELGEAPAEDVDKKRKRARKSQTVETNLKNITLGNFDMEFEMDPSLQKMPSMPEEGGSGCLLLNNLHCYDESCEIILDYTATLPSAYDQNMAEDASGHIRKHIDIKLLADVVSTPAFDTMPVCTAFGDFSFMNWSATDSSPEDMMKSSLERLGKNVHVFDIDAEPEPIPSDCNPHNADESGSGDIIDDGFGPIDDADDDDDNGDAVKSEAKVMLMPDNKGEEAKLLETAIASIRNGEIGSLIQVLASEPSDYSYFKTDFMRTWAGPEHWKLKPKTKAEPAADKAKKAKQKEPFSVVFDENVDIDWHFKVTKAAITVTKTTLDKHTKQQTTLPEDLHYDVKQLMKLFTMSSVMVKWQTNNSAVIEVDKYNYENANDKINFCPQAAGDERVFGVDANDDDDDHNENDCDGGIDFNFTAGDDDSCPSQFPVSQGIDMTHADGTFFTGDNLVAVPRKITKIDIDYAKVAKRIDVKRLKASLWDTIRENCTSNTPLVTSPVATQQQVTSTDRQVSFRQLVNDTTKRVPSSMAKNLSIPIMFVCLLHLANEKTLKITDSNKLDDMYITVDNS